MTRWTEAPPAPTFRCRSHPRYAGHKEPSFPRCVECQLVRTNQRLQEAELKIASLMRDRESVRAYGDPYV